MVWLRGRHARRWWHRKVRRIDEDSSDQQERLEEAIRTREEVERLSTEIEKRNVRSSRVERSMREIYSNNHLAALFAYEVTRNTQRKP